MTHGEFSIQKAVAMTCRIIERCGQAEHTRINYLKLMKLMYLIEKQSLESYGRFITNDKFVSMKRGPVLSNTYSAIKNDLWGDDQPFWNNYLKTEVDTDKRIFDCVIKHNGNTPNLNKTEEVVVDVVLDVFGSYSEFELVEYTHKSLPEWNREVGSSASPIEIDKMESDLLGYSVAAIEKRLQNVPVL